MSRNSTGDGAPKKKLSGEGRHLPSHKLPDESIYVADENGAQIEKVPEPPRWLAYVLLIPFSVISILVTLGALMGRLPIAPVMAVLGVYVTAVPVVIYYHFRRGGRS